MNQWPGIRMGSRQRSVRVQWCCTHWSWLHGDKKAGWMTKKMVWDCRDLFEIYIVSKILWWFSQLPCRFFTQSSARGWWIPWGVSDDWIINATTWDFGGERPVHRRALVSWGALSVFFQACISQKACSAHHFHSGTLWSVREQSSRYCVYTNQHELLWRYS